MPAFPHSLMAPLTALALLLAAPAHAVIGLQRSALEAKDTSGNAIPGGRLQISFFGSGGRDVEHDIQTNESGQVPIQCVPDNEWDAENAWDGKGEDPSSFERVTDRLSKPVQGDQVGNIPVLELQGAKQWTLRLVVKHRRGRKQEAGFLLNLG